MFIDFIVVALLAATLVAVPVPAFALRLNDVRARWRIPQIVFFAAIATIVLGEQLTLSLVDAAYRTRPNLLRLEHDLPIKLMGFRDSYHIAASFGTELLGIALVQTAALAVVAIAMLRPTRVRAIAIGIGALVAAGDALAAHTGTSGDAYSNVGYALLGMRSYLPPKIAFAGDFAPISQWWGVPLVPAPYGPLWIVVLQLVTAAGSTLLAKIVSLRVFGIVSIAMVVALLWALRFSPVTLALVALNPALTFEFVANVHNDLFAVAILLGSRLACERGKPRLGVALAICAGLIKLPFALFAASSFETSGSRRSRIVSIAITIVGTVALSYALTDGALFAGIVHHLGEHVPAAGIAPLIFTPAFVARILALAALVALIAASWWNEGIVYAIPLIGIQFYPWYDAWSLPYAALRERALVRFLLALPVLRIVVDFTLASGDVIVIFQKAIVFVLVIATLIFAMRRFRRATPASEAR